jgi:hypothetical protein
MLVCCWCRCREAFVGVWDGRGWGGSRVFGLFGWFPGCGFTDSAGAVDGGLAWLGVDKVMEEEYILLLLGDCR